MSDDLSPSGRPQDDVATFSGAAGRGADARQGAAHDLASPLVGTYREAVEQGSSIRFWRHGGIVDVGDVPATTTVLDWLRRDPQSRGTKEGCNEGDCGACTVVVADLDTGCEPFGLRWRSINACLTMLPMLHGRALFTVEDVAWAAGGSLHPIQRTMAEGNGTQCGFCSPGMVMSLWCLGQQAAASGHRPTRDEIATGLAGNLCRCTGYRSILAAGEEGLGAPSTPFDTGSVIAALRDLRTSGTFRYHPGHGPVFVSPQTISEFDLLVRVTPDAGIIAGGTDLTPILARPGHSPGTLIWTGRVAEMVQVSETPLCLRIGGAATLEDAWAALCARIPLLTQMWTRFAAPAIRHMGTMAGNLVTASPIGDSAPVLMALDATVELRRGQQIRSVPVSDLYTGYRQTALLPGEFVAAIEIPTASLDRDVHAFKLSKRFDSDISSVSAAMWVALQDGAVTDARFSFGGMAPSVVRAAHVESALIGRAWDRDALDAAQRALAGDLSALSDHRGAAEYRMQAARGLLERFWLQTRPDQPLSRAETEIRCRP